MPESDEMRERRHPARCRFSVARIRDTTAPYVKTDARAPLPIDLPCRHFMPRDAQRARSAYTQREHASRVRKPLCRAQRAKSACGSGLIRWHAPTAAAAVRDEENARAPQRKHVSAKTCAHICLSPRC